MNMNWIELNFSEARYCWCIHHTHTENMGAQKQYVGIYIIFNCYLKALHYVKNEHFTNVFKQ